MRASCRPTPAQRITFYSSASDNSSVRQLTSILEAPQAPLLPWAIQMRAISTEEPGRLVQTLTGAILACGGWVLSRSSDDFGTVTFVFEFERRACLDIYTVLVATGIELRRSDHVRFTELCQCTRLSSAASGTEIASIELEIQTAPALVPSGVAPARSD